MMKKKLNKYKFIIFIDYKKKKLIIILKLNYIIRIIIMTTNTEYSNMLLKKITKLENQIKEEREEYKLNYQKIKTELDMYKNQNRNIAELLNNDFSIKIELQQYKDTINNLEFNLKQSNEKYKILLESINNKS